MDTLDQLRARFGRYSDLDLERLLTTAGDGLPPESRQVLVEEAVRRGLTSMRVPMAPVVQSPSRPGDVWHYPKARVGARFLASIIDTVIGIMLPVLAGTIGFITAHGRLMTINGLLLLSSIVWAIYYNFTKDGHDQGRSIGKRAMGLMVVNIKTNEPCTKGESSLRALMLGILNAVPFIGTLIEPLVILVQSDGRRVGDMVAGTQVIDATCYDPGAFHSDEGA